MEWITTENIEKEIWKRILDFTNDEYTIRKIIGNHGDPKSRRMLENYKKQARQIRLSLIQANEYFKASEASTLATSPLLNYYGALSLCTATMLINGDGNKSLDILRKNNTSKNHGLTINIKENDISKGLNLLQNTQIKIEKDGFFKNWYETIPKHELLFGYCEEEKSETTRFFYHVTGQRTNADFSEIQGDKISLSDALNRIPDLVPELKKHQTPIECASSRLKVKIDSNVISYQWLIKSPYSDSAMNSVLEQFRIDSNYIENLKYTELEGALGLFVNVNKHVGEKFSFLWPDSRSTLYHDEISFGFGITTPEIVDCFGILYGFGMLCRYYPDIWIENIDSHSLSSKIAERAIEILRKKISLLALELLESNKVVISNQQPPWKTI